MVACMYLYFCIICVYICMCVHMLVYARIYLDLGASLIVQLGGFLVDCTSSKHIPPYAD